MLALPPDRERVGPHGGTAAQTGAITWATNWRDAFNRAARSQIDRGNGP
jgi:hypothetical protein